MVTCTVCEQSKAPRGRSTGLGCSYCDLTCPGYALDPQPGELWPNERYGDSLGHMDWHETDILLNSPACKKWERKGETKCD